MSVRLRRLGLATFLAVAATAAPASAASTRGYVVVLKDKPLASYAGGVAGRPATSPKATGAKKLSTRSAASREYTSYLDGRQSAVVGRLPGKRPEVLDRYRVALAGFAAILTPAQVRAARKDPAVAHVFKDRFQRAQDDAPASPAAQTALLDGPGGDSAAYLGLPAGLWSQAGTPGPDHAGEGVVVGVIDTGITPEHPSFADTPGGAGGPYLGLPFPPAPSTYTGYCGDPTDPDGLGFAKDPSFTCNNKLVGAEYFAKAATTFGTLNQDEKLSPRDTEGHGSHTASTAVGNFGVNPIIKGNDLAVNRISGVAPAAQLSVYKALWTDDNGDNGGYTSDLVAAIDAAVADGVDVISYSIGSSGTSILTADSLAFLNAADAGVFVSVSASNDGPDPGTIGDPAGVPWVTSAAAGSNGRTFAATLDIDGEQFTGASAGSGVTSPVGVVDAADIPAAGRTSEESELCLNGSLSAAAAGKIVLCKRGAPVRLQTSGEVARVGGVGEILYNQTQGNDLAGYPFIVPTIAVELDDGEAIKEIIADGAGGGVSATITAGASAANTPKKLAAFSSRGPSTASPDIAKPDVEAPGVDILGANTPIPIPGSAIAGTLFQVISGTSMAAPHVSGAGALLRQLHPAWTPAEIKSALMTTASSGVVTETGDPATPFDTGSGEIDPNKATNVGLVVDTTTADYVDYLNGPDGLDAGGDVPAVDLNLPSIAKASVLNSVTTARRFSSTLNGPKTYTVTASVPGFTVQLGGDVAGGQLTVPGGRSRTVALKATLNGAPYDEYAFGQMTLTPVGGGQALHLPISLKPVKLAAPDFVDVETDTPSGTAPLSVQTGFAGPLFGYATGLAAPNVRVGEKVSTDQTVSQNTPNAGNVHYDITVPEGADLLRAEITNSVPDDSDLDLYLYYDANGDGTFDDPDELYDLSATGASNEALLEFAPDPGKYRLVVNGFGTANPSTYDFTTWLVADKSPNDLADEPSVAITDPVTATLGGTVEPQLSYRGLNAAGSYVGVVRYSQAAGKPSGDSLLDASVVTVTKTKDEPVPTPTSTPTATPTTAPTATPTASPTASPTVTPTPRFTASFSKVHLLRKRTVRLTAKLSASAKLSARVTRKGKVRGKSRSVSVKKGTHTVRLRLNRKLRKGTYRMTIRAVGGGRLVTKTYKLKVK